MLRDRNGVKLWSGGDRLAPPTSEHESPLDGDAFRMCKLTVMGDHGPHSCVFAFHMFSDAIQLAWSGGMSLPLTWGCGASGVLCERAGQMLRPSSHVVDRSVLTSCQARSYIISCFHGSLTWYTWFPSVTSSTVPTPSAIPQREHRRGRMVFSCRYPQCPQDEGAWCCQQGAQETEWPAPTRFFPGLSLRGCLEHRR